MQLHVLLLQSQFFHLLFQNFEFLLEDKDMKFRYEQQIEAGYLNRESQLIYEHLELPMHNPVHYIYL